jgi:transposase
MTLDKKSVMIVKNQRRKFTSEFKSKVVIEALTEKQTVNEIADKFDLNPKQVSEWKKLFLTKAYLVFELEEIEKESELTT